ncbi:MAG: lipopolysaccharide biosynthesis protein [Bacteroidota bacterium]
MKQNPDGQPRKHEFLRNVFTLFSGSLASSAIPFLATIILSRYFSEEVFGTFFVFSSTVAVLSILGTLQYELAIMLPDNEHESVNLFVLSIAVTVIVSLLLLVAVALLHNPVVRLLGDEGMSFWLWFVPLSVLLTGIFQAYNYWCNRFKRYSLISWSKVSRATTMSALQIGAGFAPLFKSFGLIAGQIIGQLIGNLHIIYLSMKETRAMMKFVSWKKMLFVARKYRDVPLFNTLLQGMNSLSNQLPVFLLTRFFGTATAGQYGMSNRIIATPMGLIGQSTGQVFFQKATEVFNARGDFYGLIKKTYVSLLKVAALPYLLMLIFAPLLFSFFFGAKWGDAGIYTQVLVPWLFMMFLNSPLTFIITILNKQRQMVVYDSMLIIMRFASLYVGYKVFSSTLVCLALFSATGFLFNLVLMFYFLYISKHAYRGK